MVGLHAGHRVRARGSQEEERATSGEGRQESSVMAFDINYAIIDA